MFCTVKVDSRSRYMIGFVFMIVALAKYVNMQKNTVKIHSDIA